MTAVPALLEVGERVMFGSSPAEIIDWRPEGVVDLYHLRFDSGSELWVSGDLTNVLAPVRSLDELLDVALLPGKARDTTDPEDLDLQQLTRGERYSLPSVFHRPIWYGLTRPPLWVCAVCWDSSELSGWPCAAAARDGADLAAAIGVRCVT